MTTIKVCSHCHLPTLKCNCDGFHPEIEIPDDLMVIDKEEGTALMAFFMDNGYVSHEFHMPVHSFIRRLSEFVK